MCIDALNAPLIHLTGIDLTGYFTVRDLLQKHLFIYPFVSLLSFHYIYTESFNMVI